MSTKELSEKIILGTVQLGLSYGINNTTGKPNQNDAFEILDCASTHNIHILDSADAYGDSLNVIGAYLKRFPESNFDVIGKFIDDGQDLLVKLERCLAYLNKKSLYAYMYHRFADYAREFGKPVLLDLKKRRRIERIGVSIYSLEELRTVVRDSYIDLIQAPYNVFDASPEKNDLFEEAKQAGKEIHVRSIFLQGLLFKRPEDLSGNLLSFFNPLQSFREIIKEFDLTVMQACLNHALHNPSIDGIVIGVEKRSQLEENERALLPYFPRDLSEKFQALPFPDESLLNPANWKL